MSRFYDIYLKLNKKMIWKSTLQCSGSKEEILDEMNRLR